MANTSESAGSAVTFDRLAMPAVGIDSGSSARLDTSDSSQGYSADTLSSDSGGGRGRAGGQARGRAVAWAASMGGCVSWRVSTRDRALALRLCEDSIVGTMLRC